ncbi:uncharacterized protein LOC116916160 isoform X2 [Daphnia magna]|uniref:uncharacterized protein LOC116916160 isoform X2 n=1 Tax=Daphnia magna TaxID=35525 RepID=UPI001E1BC255|nr:uncharacterized protein LOC116916160 isoform X2 [Daphnia magna]
MHFLVLFSAFIAAATTAPVIQNSGITSQLMGRTTPIFAGSSVNMYSPFYYLTTKLKLLPKDIIICIINPTKCDPPLSAPTGYIAPLPEAKVPYSETSVGDDMPHVDVFDTAVASQQTDESDHFPRDKPIQQSSTSDESTNHHTIYKHQSIQISSENFTAQRSNMQIPVTEPGSQDKTKVHFDMLAHTAN